MVYTSLLCVLTFWQLTERVLCTVSMTTYETTSPQTGETISMDSESTAMENSFTVIVSKYPHVMVNITRSNMKPRGQKEPSKPKKPGKPQARILEPDPCMRWSPSLNISTDGDLRRVVVEYCHSESLPIPDTYTCVIGNVTLCIVVESPGCGHVFENLTTGNYTVLVQPLCKRCFDAKYKNIKCITPHYTRNINLGELTKFGASVDKISTNLESGSNKQTEVIVIISASCSGVLLVVIIVTYLMARYTKCTKSLSCVHCNDYTNQPPSNDQTDIERLQNSQQRSMNIGDPTETEAMLPDSFRLSQEQALSVSKEKRCICLYNDTNLSEVTLNSKAARFSKIPSCQTKGSSSAECCGKHTTDQESQIHFTANACQETLQMYFETETKITESKTLFDVPIIRDIPYHLIFNDSSSNN